MYNSYTKKEDFLFNEKKCSQFLKHLTIQKYKYDDVKCLM